MIMDGRSKPCPSLRPQYTQTSNGLTIGYTQWGFVEGRFVRQPRASCFSLAIPAEIG
jgi:hypothetical protein